MTWWACRGERIAAPPVSPGPLSLPLYGKPLDRTARKGKPLSTKVVNVMDLEFVVL